MKTYKIILQIYLLLAAGIISISSLTAQDTTDDRDYFTMQVDGLGCPFCAYGLEKKFKKFKALKDLKLDMETGVFTFNYPASEGLTVEEVEKQVDAAGYTAIGTKIERADGTVINSAVGASDKINQNNVVKTTIMVNGKCSMCTARIRKAAFSVEGVAAAEWNEDTKILALKYDKSLTSPEDVEKAMARVGHDTRNHKASDETYKNLPSCCHYKRNLE